MLICLSNELSACTMNRRLNLIYGDYHRHLRRERVFRDRLNPLDYLDDDQVIYKYRLNRRAIVFLCQLLEDSLTPVTERSHALPTHTKVLASLHLLASGSFQRVSAESQDICISQASMSVVLKAFCNSLCQHKNRFIKFPVSEADKNRQQLLFFEKYRLPSVVGLIDGTHIQIIRPHDHEETYVNRNSYHSLNIQVVVNFEDQFTNVVAKWPGSMHDSVIFQNSELETYLSNTANPGVLLGDSGYACSNVLLTPHRDETTPNKLAFNR